jgi:hypothetical protein
MTARLERWVVFVLGRNLAFWGGIPDCMAELGLGI